MNIKDLKLPEIYCKKCFEDSHSQLLLITKQNDYSLNKSIENDDTIEQVTYQLECPKNNFLKINGHGWLRIIVTLINDKYIAIEDTSRNNTGWFIPQK